MRIRWRWVFVGVFGLLVAVGCGDDPPPTEPNGATHEAPAVEVTLPASDASERVAQASESGSVHFVPPTLHYRIARDYDQRLAIELENRSERAISCRAELGPLGEGLLGSLSGPGALEPLHLAAGGRATLGLSLFAQDAERCAYQSHLALREAESGRLLALSPLVVLVDPVALDLRVSVGDPEPGTLARLITVENHGSAITDLSVRAGEGLAGLVTFEPSVDHGYLAAGARLALRAVPRLRTGYSTLTGEIVFAAGGSLRSERVEFPLPPGLGVFLATSRSTGSHRSHSKYCTNCPSTNTGLGGFLPPGTSIWDVLRDGIAGSASAGSIGPGRAGGGCGVPENSFRFGWLSAPGREVVP